MAEPSDSRGKSSQPQKEDPMFADLPASSVEPARAPAAPAAPVRRPTVKAKQGSWAQQNQVLVVGISAGVIVLVAVLVLCWMAGIFGGSSKPSSPPVAMQPGDAPSAPSSAPAPQGTSPSSPAPAPEVKSEEPKKDEPKKEEPKQEEKPPLPDDVTKWKAGDYRRARRENHPKLLEAIQYLGVKYVGSEPTARGLTELLKPLPAEKPASDKPSAPAPNAPPVAAPSAPPTSPPTPMPSAGPGSATASGSGRASGARGPAGPALGPGGMPTPPQTPPSQPAVNPNNPAASPWNPSDLTRLVETIVEALGCNGSGAAGTTLEGVLAGSFKTDDDKAAVEATLKTLVAHPGDSNNGLLLRVLTASDALRPAAQQGPWSAKDMKDKAFELVKQAASADLRTKWAETLMANRPRIEPGEPVGDFLLASDPLNCGAQVVFYEKASPGKDLKARLEQQLASYGSMALARCLGLPVENLPAASAMPAAPGMPGGIQRMPGNAPMRIGGSQPVGARPGPAPAPPGPPAAPAMPPTMPTMPPPNAEAMKPAEIDVCGQLAGRLWAEPFRGLLESQLSNVKLIEKQPQLLLLAATIPEDSTRAALYRTIRKHWDEGPKGLESVASIEQMLADPALLVTVKTAPTRKESSTTPKASDALIATPARGARPGGTTATGSALKKLQASQAWMDVSAKLVSAWCKRLEAVATAKESEGDKGGATGQAANASESRLPAGFELNRDAEVTASYHVALPAAAPASFSQAQPGMLDLYYVRAKETSKPKWAISRYRSQTHGLSDIRVLDGRKTWIDCVRVDQEKDRRRSIDVLISKPDGAPAAADSKGNEETDLIVEILIIEINDPSKEPSKE
jgi:hypothetical protein